MVIATAGGSG